MKRKCGISKRESVQFGSAQDILNDLFPKMLLEDLEDSLKELGRNGFLNNFYADNTVYNCTLTDYAIVTIEKLPKDDLKTISKFISAFIKFIP